MLELELLEYYKKMCERNIVLAFQGALSQDILVGIAETIKSKFTNQLLKPNLVKKIFAVFIEMAQNIAYYSAERIKMENNSEVGAGIILVTEKNKAFTITSGNLVDKNKIMEIISHCNKINSLNSVELKDFYKTQIKSARVEGKKGGGIGLIDIARRSGNPITYGATPVDNINSFLVLSVKIEEDLNNGKPEN